MMGAASRALAGEYDAPCPRGDGGRLRFYFHRFNAEAGTGTMWAWCPTCGTTTHLPRVQPTELSLRDPFAGLSLQEFAAIELDPDDGLLDRLDRLWDEGAILADA
jgi:hypothetical protein